MSVDAAVAALRIWAIDVDVADEVFTVPAKPAADWFLAICSDEAFPIVPGMLEDPRDGDAITDMLLDGELTTNTLREVNREALEAASGWRWYEAERLIVSAASQWRLIGGILGSHGVDLTTQSLGSVLATIYTLATQAMTKEDRFAFDAQLTAIPPGQRVEDFDESQFAEAFAELITQARRQGG